MFNCQTEQMRLNTKYLQDKMWWKWHKYFQYSKSWSIATKFHAWISKCKIRFVSGNLSAIEYVYIVKMKRILISKLVSYKTRKYYDFILLMLYCDNSGLLDGTELSNGIWHGNSPNMCLTQNIGIFWAALGC